MPELKPRSIRPEQSGSLKEASKKQERNVRERSGRKLKSAQNSVSSSGLAKPGEHGRLCGGLAQLGERLPCKQEVSGSIPLISTSVGKMEAKAPFESV